MSLFQNSGIWEFSKIDINSACARFYNSSNAKIEETSGLVEFCDYGTIGISKCWNYWYSEILENWSCWNCRNYEIQEFWIYWTYRNIGINENLE